MVNNQDVNIELRDISHSFIIDKKKKPLLEKINLTIGKNEVVSLVGVSGSGKTTLVNIIAGFLKPDAGQILIEGSEVTTPGQDRIVINQQKDVFDWMTLEQNIRLVCNDQKIIDKSLRLTNLYEFRSYFPHQISGGMLKRLSIARAFAVKPKFIIMDEPFASLDYLLKDKLHRELQDMIESTSNSILLITHDIEEAIFLSDRIIILGGIPSNIMYNIPINMKRPRALNIKETVEFNKVKSEIKELLK